MMLHFMGSQSWSFLLLVTKSPPLRMAAVGRTVRVSGLPVDIPEQRLLDKIQIHFLRRKNGGGEITSVAVCKTSPGTALITFEDSEVAARLAQQGRQVFRVNEKTYDVIVSLHHASVDADKVLLHMTVTVDHSTLHQGKPTLLALQRSFPGVQITFDPHSDLCTLDGCYTEVQSMSNLLLGSCNSQIGEKPPAWTEEGRERRGLALDSPANHPVGAGEEFGQKRPLQQTEEVDVELHTTSWASDQLSSYSPQKLHDILTEGEWNVEPESKACFEDFSFVVDSDIFRYLHKYCAKEYQNILKRHRVEVLDETCQDITTLYLKPKKGLSQRGMSPVKRAQQDLAQLYQDKGSQLRKEQISKTSVQEKHLEQVLETLRQRLPLLMIEEEEGNVYLVGSGSDVSEAKQFITDVKRTMEGKMVDREMRSDHQLLHSQSNFPFSRQTPPALLSQSDIFQPLKKQFQDSDNLRSDYQKAGKDENHNSERPNYGDLRYFDEHTHSSLFTQQPQNDDIFRREEVERTKPSSFGNLEKSADILSAFPKSSFTLSTLDLDRSLPDNTDHSSEETVYNRLPDTNSDAAEKQLKSAKVRKTKRIESGRELKMAANFSREICTGSLADTRNAKDPKTEEITARLEEGAFVYERPPDGSPCSLPFIKPSLNSNLKPNPMSKIDVLVPRGDVKKRGPTPASCEEKKPEILPSYSTETHQFSLGHMDLCGDAGITKNPASASGLALKRSNSFSGRIRTGQDKQTAVDLSAKQQGRIQGSQRREIFTVDVPVSINHWLYLKSVCTTEIDDLTSDLQLKEDISKEKFALCLKGADLEKVKVCQRGLRTLIATVETDFDARTLPLSMLGVSHCKDKTLVEFCVRMKQSYERVKILVMSKKVMILGPRIMCEEVEATLLNVFSSGGSQEKTHKPSTPPINTDHVMLNNTSKPLTEYPTLTSTENAQVVTKEDLLKMSDQSNACISKKDRTTATELMVVDHDNPDQDNQGKNWNKVDNKQDAEVEPAPRLQTGERGASSKETKKNDNIVTSVRRSEEDEKIDEEQRMGASQNRPTFTERMDPGGSVSQTESVLVPPGVPGLVLSSRMISHKGGDEGGGEGFPSHCVGGAQCSGASCTACAASHSSEWLEEAHPSSKCSQSETQQGSWGIRGTMSIRESTITIPGYIRDTTLRITYDIPDGIQGEDDPCPGAPFKGNKFEAFLPLNDTTKKLLPLLEKAFHKGLTFAVRAEPSGSQGPDSAQGGKVVWGSVPHKTRIEGGTSKNGYPDSTYIRRLTQTLKTAGLEE